MSHANRARIWDPFVTLELQETKGCFTCVGHAPSQGRRCHNPIASINREDACKLLKKLATREPSSVNMRDQLTRLASMILCKRNHQNQAGGLIRKWERLIDDLEPIHNAETALGLPRASGASSSRGRRLALEAPPPAATTSHNETLERRVQELEAMLERLASVTSSTLARQSPPSRRASTVQEDSGADSEEIVYRTPQEISGRTSPARSIRSKRSTRSSTVATEATISSGGAADVRAITRPSAQDRTSHARSRRSSTVATEATIPSGSAVDVRAVTQPSAQGRTSHASSRRSSIVATEATIPSGRAADIRAVTQPSAQEPITWFRVEVKTPEDGHPKPTGSSSTTVSTETTPTATASTCSERHVARRMISADCPACYEPLGNTPLEEVLWCKSTCGQSVHKECFEMWRARSGSSPKCIYCRCPWVPACDHDTLTKPAPANWESVLQALANCAAESGPCVIRLEMAGVPAVRAT